MDLEQLTVSRRTVHNYASEKVPSELVDKALRLSLFAPNHKLTYPWVYIDIGPAAREKLADLSVQLKSAKASASLSPVKQQALRDNVLKPSHLIALGIHRDPDTHRLHEDYATLACSVQIASLYLWENSVASKWSTGGFSMHEKTYEILGLNPLEVSLEGCLMIGRAEVMPAAPQRPALEKHLHRVP